MGALKPSDYRDYLTSTSKDYLRDESVQKIKLDLESESFLKKIYERLTSSNETFLQQKEAPVFVIVKNELPFLFSLPGNQYFFSSSLIQKYLKSEGLFVAAFAAEILKSHHSVYEKKAMLPLGFYKTEKMIHLTRVKIETKLLISEWTYIILKRAGFDASLYLNWIQVQNRNTQDFAFFLGEPVGISREEYSFKNFLIKQRIDREEKKTDEANSSKEFYKFLKNIKSKV